MPAPSPRTKPSRVRSNGRLAVIQLSFRCDRAVSRLKPGGVLVYSTCSLEADENTSVVRQLLREQPQLKLDREHAVMPFQDKVDGAYVASLSHAA